MNKEYVNPAMRVVRLQTRSIICTSHLSVTSTQSNLADEDAIELGGSDGDYFSSGGKIR